MDNSDIATRMKTYEQVSKQKLTSRMPLIIRIDGKAFHTVTRYLARPDLFLNVSMWATAARLCREIQGCKLAYVQSDEVSLLLTDYDTLQTQAWFEKDLIKIVSVSASIATLAFNASLNHIAQNYWDYIKGTCGVNDILPFEFGEDKTLSEYLEVALFDKAERACFDPSTGRHIHYVDQVPFSITDWGHYDNVCNSALFDSRAFVVPKEDVCNYFIWRQQDATRNAIQMQGQKYFSSKQLHKRTCKDIQEMLFQEKQINFDEFDVFIKRGVCLVKQNYDSEKNSQRSKWCVDFDIPIFTQNRKYIEKFVYIA